MARFLLVEDDETIGRALRASLTLQGHAVGWARTGHDALDDAAKGPFDLVLLDLGLPDLDGVTVCRRLRQQQPGAVIVVLTARDDEMDVIVGLEAGADDYLTKPIGLGELYARLCVHLRRVESGRQVTGGSIVLGDLVVDVVSRRVSLAGSELPLRAKEYELLLRLAADPGVAVSREALISDVWDAGWFGSTKTLDVHIGALRRHLVARNGERAVPAIVTLRGHGYRLDVP